MSFSDANAHNINVNTVNWAPYPPVENPPIGSIITIPFFNFALQGNIFSAGVQETIIQWNAYDYVGMTFFPAALNVNGADYGTANFTVPGSTPGIFSIIFCYDLIFASGIFGITIDSNPQITQDTYSGVGTFVSMLRVDNIVLAPGTHTLNISNAGKNPGDMFNYFFTFCNEIGIQLVKTA